MKRTTFLRSVSIWSIMVIGVWRTYSQHSEDRPEYEPWKNWRSDAHAGPLNLVRAAVLASNAFNTQPWLFRVTKSQIRLYADLRRNLGTFDPYLWDMHLSLGCPLENLMLAATANGYMASLSLPPGKLEKLSDLQKPELVGQVDLAAGKRETK